MLDASRNGVMTVSYAKSVLRRLALMGYNMAMLYTEDTYELDGEPHFGFLRGAYTFEEIKKLDDYAHTLGIELIPCIQTLGHLPAFLRSSGAAPVRDTDDILLAEEEKTYALIRKMLSFWSHACRSRRIHIGMDETHDLGRGKYMDRNGWRRGFDLFNAHLARVNFLCRKEKLEPMIWSDMYFRMGSATGDYYDYDANIPPDVVGAIPSNVRLVYWDYYHLTEEIYDKMIAAHRRIGCEPPVGSGLWTWYSGGRERFATPDVSFAADFGRSAYAVFRQFLRHIPRRTEPQIRVKNPAHQVGFLLYRNQLFRLRVGSISQRSRSAAMLPLFLGGGNFIANTLGDDFALILGESHQDIEHHPPGAGRGVDVLRHADERDMVAVKQRQQLRELQQTAGKPVDFVDDHGIDLSGFDILPKPYERRTVGVAAAVSAVIVMFRQTRPAVGFLAGDKVFSRLALGVQRIEFHVQPFVGAFARVDGATFRSDDFSHV